MRQYFNNKGRIILGALLLALSLLLALYLILPDKAGSGVYLISPHGASTGVNRTPASITAGHCQHCHDPHAGPTSGVTGGPYGYNLYKSRVDNAICFTAEAGTGCHAGSPPAGYPAQEADRMPGSATQPPYSYYFEKNAAGVKTTGLSNRVRWPGQAAYIDTGTTVGGKAYSPHYVDTNMPLPSPATGQGLCANCHNPHGTDTALY
ncbi:MAG: hypothetical protein Q8K51_05035, partial [Nitrospirota bacterium]|nr:hypothetical protein [Nitrospirota bacterium]